MGKGKMDPLVNLIKFAMHVYLGDLIPTLFLRRSLVLHWGNSMDMAKNLQKFSNSSSPFTFGLVQAQFVFLFLND